MEVGVIWGEGREQETAGGLGDRSREGGRGMGRGLSYHHVVLRKVRLVGAWTKRREVAVGVRRIGSEKLREHQNREGNARFPDGKGVEWDGVNNVEYMWEQVQRAMVESTIVRFGGKYSKSELKLQLQERGLLGRKCWQLVMKKQKKDVWKRTGRRRERLKDA